MEEGERKLCLVVVRRELTEETLVQVQLQLLELMEGVEALAAEEEAEAKEEMVLHLTHLLIVQEEMAEVAELVVMEAAVEQEVQEGGLIKM